MLQCMFSELIIWHWTSNWCARSSLEKPPLQLPASLCCLQFSEPLRLRGLFPMHLGMATVVTFVPGSAAMLVTLCKCSF